MITFTCNIKPHPQQRARYGRGTVYDPESNKIYAAAIRQAFRLENPDHVPYRGAVEMRIEFRFAIPKTKTKERKQNDKHAQKPDLDNCIKAVKDALKGLAWADDCQVCLMIASKIWSNQSSVVFTIWES